MDNLSPRYQLYANAKLAGETDHDAAITAGYKPSGAEKQGYRLSGNVQIQDYITARQQAASDLAEVSAEDIIRELAAVAFAHVRDVMDWTEESITLKRSADLEHAASAAIKSVKMVTITTHSGKEDTLTRVETQIVMHDKIAPLRDLGKWRGLFTDSIDTVLIINQVRELARGIGADEEAAVEEVERWLAAQK